MSLERLAAEAAAEGLACLGAFRPEPEDGAPGWARTVALLGPDGPRFWASFAAAPEYADGAPDPVDRWSRRVIGALAAAIGGAALFPFEGPPWPPFQRWARRTGRAWDSPVGMLVHAERGLFVSYRGAIATAEAWAIPPPAARPCPTCAARKTGCRLTAPCRAACPVNAFGPEGYDVAACRAHLAAPEGAACRDAGCRVRRACPVGAAAAPLPEQAAFHLAAFRGL
jgi:hypothetical protein